MYSTIKSIQLLTALLKKYNINKLVLSPGGSDIPIIHSLENDDFFECHSVVDERSAVYYGIGLAQQTKSPRCLYLYLGYGCKQLSSGYDRSILSGCSDCRNYR